MSETSEKRWKTKRRPRRDGRHTSHLIASYFDGRTGCGLRVGRETRWRDERRGDVRCSNCAVAEAYDREALRLYEKRQAAVQAAVKCGASVAGLVE